MEYNNCNDTELYHYGVPGMKLGIRKKYESSDRESGTPEKKKSNHRLKLEEKYRAKGMSQEEADHKARNRIRAERIALGTAPLSPHFPFYLPSNKTQKKYICQMQKIFSKPIDIYLRHV